jgi:uncharacterized protein YecE (DUF72 family)
MAIYIGISKLAISEWNINVLTRESHKEWFLSKHSRCFDCIILTTSRELFFKKDHYSSTL